MRQGFPALGSEGIGLVQDGSDSALFGERGHWNRDVCSTCFGQLPACGASYEGRNVVIFEDSTQVRQIEAGLGANDMSVVVYPGLPADAIRNSSFRGPKVPTILGQQNQGFIKDIAVNGPLQAICPIVRIGTSFSLGFRHRPAFAIQEIDDSAKCHDRVFAPH